MTRTVLHLAMLAMSGIGLVACAGPAPPPSASVASFASVTPSADSSATPVGEFPIKTMTPEASATDQPCPAALIDGTLAEHPVTGLGLQTDELIVVVWPWGWRGASGPPVALLREDGAVVATVGQKLSIGGGYVNEQWLGCGGVTVVD
jgi:hypothetical protein